MTDNGISTNSSNWTHALWPHSVAEVLRYWKNHPEMRLFSGGTSFFRSWGEERKISRDVIMLDGVEELKRITRTERYIEFGSMVSLSRVLFRQRGFSGVLTDVIMSLTEAGIRNLASIGGFICDRTQKKFAAALIALNARYELRGLDGSPRLCSAARFAEELYGGKWTENELLTRVRLPLENWDVHETVSLDTSPYAAENIPENERFSGQAVFLARVQNGVLADLRAVFAGGRPGEKFTVDTSEDQISDGGAVLIRDRSTEYFLVGRRYPLDLKDVNDYAARWKELLNAKKYPPAFIKESLLRFIFTSALRLCQ
jgi:xanthine dehydrogenase iron-sulfur cluster and FAD-binding subunit A